MIYSTSHSSRMRLTLVIAVLVAAAQAGAAVLWQTDFAGGGTTLADFQGSGAGQFVSSGTKGSGAPTLEFDDAGDTIQLRTYSYPVDTLGHPFAGVAQTDFGLGAQTALRLTLTITPHMTDGVANSRGLLQIGTPSAWDTASATFGKFTLDFKADGLALNRGVATSSMSYDTVHTIDFLVVNSNHGSNVDYLDPSASTQTVAQGTTHIYIDGVYEGAFAAVSGREGHNLAGFQLNIGGSQVSDSASMRGIDVHSLVVSDSLDVVPEPASMALLLASGLAMAVRRR